MSYPFNRKKIPVVKAIPIKKKKGLNTREKGQVKKLITAGRENKYLDVLLLTTELFSGNVYSLSNVPQGDTDITRNGDQLVQRALRVKGNVIVSDTTNMSRLILFRWKNESVPVVGDILSATYVGTPQAPHSPYHHDGRTNFTVLYDKTFSVDTYNTQRIFDTGWINLRNKKQYYSGGSSSAEKNGIFALIISDSGAVGNPVTNLVSRMTYQDP